jgi:hypothetical protein
VSPYTALDAKGIEKALRKAVGHGVGYVGLKAVKTQLERENCHVLQVGDGDALQGGPFPIICCNFNREGEPVSPPCAIRVLPDISRFETAFSS